MTDTADLTTAEIGDTLVLANGTRVVVDRLHMGHAVSSGPCMHYVTWNRDGTKQCPNDHPPGSDCIRLEKRRPVTRPDPLIWGASVPGSEPVPVKAEEFMDLTFNECQPFLQGAKWDHEAVRAAHRAGWFKQRTP